MEAAKIERRVSYADELEGCTEGSPEEAGFKAIADAIEAYESRRWPDGKAPAPGGESKLARSASPQSLTVL
jgi:hypothetical protein